MAEAVVLLLALLAGLLARRLALPPLVGFLIAGFSIPVVAQYWELLADLDFEPFAEIGVTLLLFSIGLKLNFRSLLRPYIWGVAGIHMALSVILVFVLLVVLKWLGWLFLSELGTSQFLLIGFALSFSSTVFAVKVLEERGELSSFHGRIAIGILVVQDILAVLYLSLSGDKVPELTAPLVLLLVPLRPLLIRFLVACGHGELLVLAGFAFALGGAALFEVVGLKGDLGALFVGVLLSSHSKATEVSKALLNFKDLLLLAFFLIIGQSGLPSGDGWLMVLVVCLAITFKPLLYYLLFTRFRLRARTALFSSLVLNNYSEFGLIVMAVAIKSGD
jgi:predicted Kef-type K+ transport protein